MMMGLMISVVSQRTSIHGTTWAKISQTSTIFTYA